jgi:O-antigen biosynthesis protein WbqP
MQNFTDIPSSRTLSDSLIEILNNDKTAISCNSGTTFPTTNQQVGMLCYRSDQLKLYQLISTNPDSWRLIMDLASGIDTQLAAKLNAATYTAADILAKLLTVDGAGTGLDADLLDGQQASAFASSTHNHNATYLGITAKAVDADKLDGYDSTAFVRSVNGAGPDASGNSTVNIDLSSRVAKTGDTMTGNLTIQNTAPTITMQDTDTPAVATHLLADPKSHLTSIGSFLRKSSLDELPQLWSILVGDMSFVGPRPALFNQHDLIELRTQLGVHELVPGLTGWAQVNGRDELPIPQKVALDAEYLQRQGFGFDIKVLWLTFLKVVQRDGVSH